MTQEELLKYAIENGMINLGEIIEKARLDVIDKVKEIHPYRITPPAISGKDSRWQTYVIDDAKRYRRRLFKAPTEAKMYLKLAEFYGLIDNPKGITMRDTFKKWIPYKRSITNSENTIYRHFDHWRRYCEKCDIIKIPMKNISIIDLESWANELIKDHNMTRKEWQNVKVIIGGIWDFAHRKGYISNNTWKEIRITVKYRQITKQPPETQVFIGDDLYKLIAKCKELYETTENQSHLAIQFNIYCGLRVGELVALKVKDINFESGYLSVEREEVRIRTRNADNSVSYEWKIVDHTKTYTSRYIPLIPQAMEIINDIVKKHGQYSSTDRYLFTKNGDHLNTINVSKALAHACKQAGISHKSTHKIRKTFASKLNAGGVPLDEIRNLLGHMDAQTTFEYIYNPLPKEETLKLIQDSFQDNQS